MRKTRQATSSPDSRTSFASSLSVHALALLVGATLAAGCGDDDGGTNAGPDAGPDSGGQLCGDGVQEWPEECDDGADNSDIAPDACRTDCTLARCGDSTIDTGEVCDDGYSNSDLVPDACREDCSEPGCADGIVDVQHGETCDDGNTDAGDGCGATCRVEFCGNGVLDEGELCDDGNYLSGDGCSPDCLSDETCGNGIMDTAVGELCDCGTDPTLLPQGCDAANGDPASHCGADCVTRYCGNGVINPGEICDDGNNISGDGCSADCLSDETCGNAYLDFNVGEECDCGINPALLPAGCAAINGHPASGCSVSCMSRYCGNGVLDSGETCDDGNSQSGDGCSSDCQSDESCGNGYVDVAVGEQCDEGAANSDAPNALCRADCHYRRCGDDILDPAGGEVCDTSQMGTGTCADFGFYNGTLSCSSFCQYDTTTCIDTCGDGIVNGPELCDGAPPAGQSCTDYGYSGGSLGCTAVCTPDFSSCTP